MTSSNPAQLPLIGWTGPVGVALLLNRLALGLYFFLAGVGKFRMGVGVFYEQGFVPLRPAWLPEALGRPFGYALPLIELLLGLLLIAGLFSRITAGLIALLLATFTIALAQAGLFFPAAGPFHANVVFFTLAILLASVGPGRYSVDDLLAKRG